MAEATEERFEEALSDLSEAAKGGGRDDALVRSLGEAIRAHVGALRSQFPGPVVEVDAVVRVEEDWFDFTGVATEACPRDPGFDGSGWSYRNLAHDRDATPQVIRATDAEGRSCVYMPVRFGGQVVDIRADAPAPRKFPDLPGVTSTYGNT